MVLREVRDVDVLTSYSAPTQTRTSPRSDGFLRKETDLPQESLALSRCRYRLLCLVFARDVLLVERLGVKLTTKGGR